MSERTLLEGHLSEKRAEAHGLKTKLEGLRDAIRQNLDRHVPIETLRAHVVAGQAVDFQEAHLRYRDVLDEIADLERELGVGR